MTFLLTHTSQWGRPQESCLPKILPSPRVFGASPITELAGSQHSLQRLPGLMLFNNSFEQGQLTCSLFGEMWMMVEHKKWAFMTFGKRGKKFWVLIPPKSF